MAAWQRRDGAQLVVWQGHRQRAPHEHKGKETGQDQRREKGRNDDVCDGRGILDFMYQL